MTPPKPYPVHETFYSWQGEGCHQGRAAFFIRLFGCPVQCPWCDSAGTWHPDFVPKKVPRRTAVELADEAAVERPEFVVITGGEPCIHDLAPLVRELAARGIPAHLETSGAYPITGDFDWVTVSPKRAAPPLRECVARASEFKIIVDSPEAVDDWIIELSRLGWEIGDTARPVWLHPEWSKRNDPVILKTITEAVKGRRAPFRAGWQLHKNYRADALDSRAAPPAPLGGTGGDSQ